MFVQGNLRALDPEHIYLYTNTLQSIAVGYLVSAVLFYFTSIRTQIIFAAVLLLGYWAVMQFTGADGFGYGNYTPEGNMAEWIDRQVLGHYRDQSSLAADGTVVYATWYHYTWILSSLTFAATALTGVFAGHIAKSSLSSSQKLLWLLLGGTAMVAAGWICDLWMPIIKPIWTSSMVLFSSGWCWLLLGIFFLVYDILKVSLGLDFLRTYGMNSITAYVVAEVINFRGIAHSVFYGLEQYIGGWYTVFLCAFQVGMIYMILYLMKRNNIFLKV
jgi:predicted acyltransferase